MKFAAVALVGAVAASGTKTEKVGCVKAIAYYTDAKCTKFSKDKAVAAASKLATTAVGKLCKDGKMDKSTTYPLDKCTALGTKVGADATHVMYMSKAAGAKYIAAGVSAVLSFAATHF